jgi:hypothetical protein
MDFARMLVSTEPSPDLPPEHDLFGRFVGTWSVENSLFSEATGEWSHSTLTWSFARILQGRGVQDIIETESGRQIGTTVRTWDAVAGWRVVWFSPVVPEHCVLAAEALGDDRVRLDGVQSDGRRIRWEFSAITSNSFLWNGWCSNDDGVTWWHEQHMQVTRLEG